MRLGRRRFGLLGALAILPLPGRAAPAAHADTTAGVIAAAAFELFPHEGIPSERYVALASSFIAADADRAAALAAEFGAADFTSGSRAARVERMRAVQGAAAFQALRMHVMMGLYTDLEVTRRFGYEGPSFARGGYLDRGFDDVRWVPDPAADAG